MRYLDSQETAIATIQKALAIGINHLETAKGYGNSEEYLGAALQELFKSNSQLRSGANYPPPLQGEGGRGERSQQFLNPIEMLPFCRERLHITTKLPPVGNAADIDRSIDESLKRLNIDYLDCLAIHGINTRSHLDWVLNGTGMKAICKAISDRRVQHLGFSTHGSLELILDAINTDLFEFVNLHYYYFFQRHAPAIELAHQKDMGVFIISPADKGGRLHTPTATLTQLCEPFSPLELNYRFLLSDRRISTLSFGAANPEELNAIDTTSPICDRIEPLTPAELAAIARLENHLTTAIGAEKCSQCYACLPCPESINIPEVLRLRNLAVAYEMTDYSQYRYRMFENAGHWFPGMKANKCTECGDCLPRCPERLNIPDLLQDSHDRLNGKSGRRLWG